MCQAALNPLSVLAFLASHCVSLLLHNYCPASHKKKKKMPPVGRGEWIWWEPQHHQDIPSVQRVWAQPEQLAAHHVHRPTGRTTYLRGDPLHCPGLCLHTQCSGLLQRDVQPLLPGNRQERNSRQQGSGILGKRTISKGKYHQTRPVKDYLISFWFIFFPFLVRWTL